MKRCLKKAASWQSADCCPAGHREPVRSTPLTLKHDGCSGFRCQSSQAGKSYKEIKETIDAAHGNQSLKKMVVYAIIKKVKSGKSSANMCHLKK
jgi:hypothetical protein